MSIENIDSFEGYVDVKLGGLEEPDTIEFEFIEQNVSKLIHRLMIANGMNVKKLAKKSGLGKKVIRELLSYDAVHHVKLGELIMVLNALGIQTIIRLSVTNLTTNHYFQ